LNTFKFFNYHFCRDFTHFVEPLKNNLLEKGYSKPTLVQRSVIPIIEKKRGFDFKNLTNIF